MGCKIFDWIGIGESNAENDRSATEGVPGLSATRRRKANTSPAANLLWSCPINRHTVARFVWRLMENQLMTLCTVSGYLAAKVSRFVGGETVAR